MFQNGLHSYYRIKCASAVALSLNKKTPTAEIQNILVFRLRRFAAARASPRWDYTTAGLSPFGARPAFSGNCAPSG